MKKIIFIAAIYFLATPGWTQSNWAPAGMPFNGAQVRCLYYDVIEDVLWVGGDIRDGIPNNQVLLKYDGVEWASYGHFDNQILAITRFQDKIIVGGFFTEFNGTPCSKLAYLEGDEFLPLGTGSDGVIQNLKVIAGKLYVCGAFSYVGDAVCNLVAVYNGENWLPLEGLPEVVYTDQCSDIFKHDEDFWIGGNYDPIAWEETDESDIFYGFENNWQPAGGGISGSISDVRSLIEYNGELIAGGAIYQSAGNAGHSIMKWNDSELIWEELGGSITGPGFSTSSFSPVEDMDVFDGKLYITGKFENAGDIYSPYITVWDGEKYCWPGGIFTGYGGGGQIEFFHDTLYMACRDSVDGQFVNNLAKYVGDWAFEGCSTVEVSETKANVGMMLYPNPATDILILETETYFQENATIIVFKPIGQTILTTTWPAGEKKKQIEVEHLSNGLYFISIATETGVKNLKFVKQ